MGFSRASDVPVARVDQRVTAAGFFHVETGERGGDHAKVWLGFRHGDQFALTWAAG